MLRIILALCAFLLLTFPVSSSASVTVLEKNISLCSECSVPVIDALETAALEQNANKILSAAVHKMADKVGKKGRVSFEVGLNKNELVSFLIKGEKLKNEKNKGENNKSEKIRDEKLKGENSDGKSAQIFAVYYDAVNIDLTTGNEFGTDSFYFDGPEMEKILGKKGSAYTSVYFAENGIYTAKGKYAAYSDFHSYGDLIGLMRMGEAGRLVPIVKLTRNCEDMTLTVDKGTLIALNLATNPSTGYQWMESISEGEVFLPGYGSDENTGLNTGLNIKTGLYRTGRIFTLPHEGVRNVPGSPGTELQFFHAAKKGIYTVTMSYKRPWENVSGVYEFSFKVRVK